MILSFGGGILSADEIEDNKKKAQVTHYVMDRPLSDAFLNGNQNKEFVQPQYIIDSINNLFMLPTSQYKPGIPPPAHLSPFIDNEAEGYVPMRHKEIQHLKGEEVVESDNEEEVALIPEKPTTKRTTRQAKKEVSEKIKGDADSSSEEDDSDDEPVAKTAKER